MSKYVLWFNETYEQVGSADRSKSRTVPIAAGWLILITNSSPAIAPRGIRAWT